MMELCKLDPWKWIYVHLFYQNQHIFIQENAFENGVLKMVTVSCWAQWANAVSQ